MDLMSLRSLCQIMYAGSHNPEGLGGTGAGFALCWQGNPQLLINQPNDQNELIQVVSDSVMIIMPK